MTDDANETADDAERSADEFDWSFSLWSTLRDLLEELEDDIKADRPVAGTPTGFIDVDSIIGGLSGGSLMVVGARPAMGKTSLVLGIASHVALEEDLGVVIFSPESSKRRVTETVLCARAKVDVANVRTGQANDDEWRKLADATATCGKAPIWIDDDPKMTVDDIRDRSIEFADKRDVGLVVVDNIHFLADHRGAPNRYEAISRSAIELKRLARLLDAPVVVVSQLSRQLEQRLDKRPILSDLRDSGLLEDVADVVMFLYRDEIYNRDSADKGQAEVLVAKQRFGPTGVARLAWLGHQQRFANMARV